MQKIFFVFGILIFFWSQSAFSQTEVERCLQQRVLVASDFLTVGELRQQCVAAREQKEEVAGDSDEHSVQSSVAERIAADNSNICKPFTLMAHRPNYLLPFAYNNRSWDSSLYRNTNGEQQLDLDRAEVQFQLSVKMPLAIDIFGSKVDAYGGYTMHSFWQAYNSEDSAPFRETDHKPEFWLQRRSFLSVGALKNVANGIGVVHQSNGQGGELSRSWNRIYATLAFEWGGLAIVLKPWFRLQEDASDDNNPDITDYLGHGELILAYEYNNNIFSLVSRNNLESGFSKGAVQLGWSFPFFDYDYLKGYVQYFHGYGESLIDYDRLVDRMGLGIIVTNFL